MRSLLRSRRGSVAFATVIALVPLIGAVALGGEAGSWYVTRQHAQNAADAAAYSGAVQQLCLLNAPCAVTQTVDYRAKQSAAQNAFCNAGGTSYPGSTCATSLPTGISQTVQIAQLTSWKGASGTFVQAIASQQQPGYLAQVLGLSTVNIGAMAVARVQALVHPPCVLSLTGSISFQGSPNINGPNCGMASNDKNANAINFTGGGMTMNLGSLSTVGGCTGAASLCSTASTYMPAPIVNQFSVLDGVTTPTLSNCTKNVMTAYSATNRCTNNNFKLSGNASSSISLAGGVYFISGTLSISGGASISGTALFILLPGASIKATGGSLITVTGNPSVAATQLPPAFQPYTSLFADMAIYKIPDPDTSKNGPNDMTFGGTSGINLSGIMYLPSANVTFQGNPTIALAGGTACGELIAASVAFNGNATFDSTGCPAATKLTSSQYVQLVQ
jgi:hypothetical protein